MKSLTAFIMGWSLAFAINSASKWVTLTALLGFAFAYLAWSGAGIRKEAE